jgi:hypothetical protein
MHSWLDRVYHCDITLVPLPGAIKAASYDVGASYVDVVKDTGGVEHDEVASGAKFINICLKVLPKPNMSISPTGMKERW